MKKLLIILLLFASTAQAQNVWKDQWLKQDKYVHLSVSAWLVPTSYVLLTDLGMKDRNAEIASLALSLGVGLSKELLYDANPSPYDLTANIVGAVAGVYLNRWLQRVEMKHYNKKYTNVQRGTN